MKLLDIFARRRHMPRYTASEKPPRDWLLCLIILTELRYESFTPNNIRVAREAENFSEPWQLGVHVGAFAFLQALPQHYSTILAFEVLLAIYIIWTSIQMLLRYRSSPALFGPLYTARSLSGFWSETWHNAFASPCESLAYTPLRNVLLRWHHGRFWSDGRLPRLCPAAHPAQPESAPHRPVLRLQRSGDGV